MWKWHHAHMSRKATRVTTEQAAEMAVQGIFAKADRDAAKRLRRKGKHPEAKRAEEEATARLRSLRERM